MRHRTLLPSGAVVVVAVVAVVLTLVLHYTGKGPVTVTTGAQRPLEPTPLEDDPNHNTQRDTITAHAVAASSTTFNTAVVAQQHDSATAALVDVNKRWTSATSSTPSSGCPQHVTTAYPLIAVSQSLLFSTTLRSPSLKATASTAVLLHVQCPTDAALLYLDAALDNDTNVDQRASHIQFKYNYYVTRCNRTQGIMWKHMTLPVMRAVTLRVVLMACELLRWPCAVLRSSMASHERRHGDGTDAVLNRLNLPKVIRVLDWASGCGAGTEILHDTLTAQFSEAAARGGIPPPRVEVVGIDLMQPAVQYANSHHRSAGRVTYCHADGTKLGWLPDGHFDIVTSFGGLLHLPSMVMCSTVQQMLSKLRPGGVMWAGYLDTRPIAEALARCSGPAEPLVCSLPVAMEDLPAVSSSLFDAGHHAAREARGAHDAVRIHTTIFKENVWFQGTQMPRVYRRKKPLSIVWHRLLARE